MKIDFSTIDKNGNKLLVGDIVVQDLLYSRKKKTKFLPKESLIISTNTSINIIDAEENILFLRFLKEESKENVLFSYNNFNQYPKQIKIKNNIMIIAYTNDEETCNIPESAGIIIDFDRNVIRYHMNLCPGSKYQGGIEDCNKGKEFERKRWELFNHSWSFLGNRVNSVDIDFKNNIEYHLLGTNIGCSVYSWNRKKPETENDICFNHFKTDEIIHDCCFFKNMIFCMSNDKIFFIPLEEIFNKEKKEFDFYFNIKGEFSNKNQHKMISLENKLFYIRNEGIYEIDIENKKINPYFINFLDKNEFIINFKIGKIKNKDYFFCFSEFNLYIIEPKSRLYTKNKLFR